MTMTNGTVGQRNSETPRWSPAAIFLVAAGLWLLVVGVVGFMIDASFPTSAAEVRESHGHIFGIFETNGWHNLAAVVIAVPSLAVVYAWPRFTRVMSLVVGVSNTAVFVLFAVIDPATVWVASNAADQVIHALTGAGGILAAIVTRSTTTRQRQAATM